MPTIPQRRFLKGLNAATPAIEQPQGTVPRVSNLLLTKRGGFVTTPGSTTLSKLGNVLTHAAPIDMLEVALFQPSQGPPTYVAVLRDRTKPLGAPVNLAAVDGGAGGLLPIGTVYWVVTANDGIGGETVVSNEVNLVFAALGKALLSWNALPGAVTYNIYRGVAPAAVFLLITISATTYTDAGNIPTSLTPPPVTDTTISASIVSVSLPSYNNNNPILRLPPPSDTVTVADALGQVPFNPTGVPTAGGATPPTPQGGVSGIITELPQLLQFNDNMIAILGNGYPPHVISSTLVPSAITNSFISVFPVRIASTAYPTSALIQVTIGGTDHIFQAQQGGVTAAGGGPVFSATLGSTVADGSIIWVNQGLVTTASFPPPGAAHGLIYAGLLWLYNTAPVTNLQKTAGPTVLQQSDLNNPNSWNPLNIVFIGKDDGTQGTGLAAFSVSETAIIPTGSLVAFKDFTTFQIFGVMGDPSFSLVQAQTDMGNVAPRSIQFIPGFGIARLSHLGPAVFDGVRDRLLGPEIYPYLFGGESDITPIDWGEAYLSKGAQAVTPPMYLLAVPLSGSGGALTRVLCYDLVLKGWTIVDLPFPISCLKQIRIASQGSQPITLSGGDGDAALRRVFNSIDVGWQDSPSLGVTSAVSWRVRTPEVVSKSAADRLAVRALYVKGAHRPTTIAAQITMDNRSLPSIGMKVTLQSGLEFEALLQMHMLGKNVHADISGTGPVELHSFDWEADAQPTVPAVLV